MTDNRHFGDTKTASPCAGQTCIFFRHESTVHHLFTKTSSAMKTSKKPWPLSSTYGIRERINTNPDFQRPAVWNRSQKQLLVDTILRDYDVPKLYWRKVGTKPDKY